MSILNIREKSFGLDISDNNLRLIQLKQKRNKQIVEIFNEIKLPPNCIIQGEIADKKTLISSLNKLTKTKKGKGKISKTVVAVLPEAKTYLKTVKLPKTDEENIATTIKKIIPQYFPVKIDDIHYSWQTVKTTDQIQTFLIGVCPKKIINDYLDTLSLAGFIPVALEIEATAIARALFTEPAKTEATIVIDIGASRTGLFVYEKDNILFTISVPVSGHKITELIVNSLNLNYNKAEAAKIACGLDQNKCHGALLEIISEEIKILNEYITKAKLIYQNNYGGNSQKINQIILCGGGSNLIKINEKLQSDNQIQIIPSNPWQKVTNPNPQYFNEHQSQSFVTAIGLALRGIEYK